MEDKLIRAEMSDIVDFEQSILATARKCELQPYDNKTVPPFKVSGWFEAFATPDSTFAVLKARLDAATSSILIGMYDFSVQYINQLLKAALARGVKVTMMLDLAPGDADASAIFDELQRLGATCVLAPSCRNAAKAHYFFVCHEKIIVIDGTITFIQSGNFSQGSTPDSPGDGVLTPGFKTGYRDMGIVVSSKEIADFFTQVITADIKLEESAEHPGAEESLIRGAAEFGTMLAIQAPQPPSQLFPSRTFTPSSEINVQPVLTPDNYMHVLPSALAAARDSILIEQQYIHAQQDLVIQLCSAIKRARSVNPSLDVRIIIAPPFTNTPKDKDSVLRDLKALSDAFGLATGTNVRLLTHRFFAHLHNKLVILDHHRVLLSSQNWSSTGVSQNREAGLLIDYPELARYYADIFEFDWSTADRSLDQVVPHTFLATAVRPEAVTLTALSGSQAIFVAPGDIADV